MAIHKRRKCMWSNKISSSLLYCIFPGCIVKEEISEEAVNINETTVVPKARTTYDDKKKEKEKCVQENHQSLVVI